MRVNDLMNVGVLGAGAVGLFLAARLSKVARVFVVARARHNARIKEEGFSLSGIWGEECCTSAEGINLPWESPEEYLEEVQLPATAGHHSSMLQDLRRGRITEIGFLNSAIMERELAHGLPVPFNTLITELIGCKESFGGAGE
ncbi:MAG: ketopantoate reductase C-terminal domain-containing protein [Methanomicrobiaceae archaeon]|nr:ketopantoate reductase C-terminal domain-containing protein [Methanomicrobiaceae archaeon]